jgi:hypothetical protein
MNIKISSVFLLVTVLLSCASDNEDNEVITELSGTWATTCSEETFFNEEYSDNSRITFKSSTVSHFSYFYTDTNCQQVDYTIENRKTLVIDGIESLEHIKRFEIGNEIVAATGETVKEIDYFTSDDKKIKDIYLIQDDHVIYFGYPCNPIFCEKGERSVLINYSRPYYKDI